ncbi:hypothetical protein FRC01_012969 [Tulasnella sp. 417]|nr:hypothetical protein FRC01_012969 [Tulasnella sp. 417]
MSPLSANMQARIRVLWAFCEHLKQSILNYGFDDPITNASRERLQHVFNFLKASEQLEIARAKRASPGTGPVMPNAAQAPPTLVPTVPDAAEKGKSKVTRKEKPGAKSINLAKGGRKDQNREQLLPAASPNLPVPPVAARRKFKAMDSDSYIDSEREDPMPISNEGRSARGKKRKVNDPHDHIDTQCEAPGQRLNKGKSRGITDAIAPVAGRKKAKLFHSDSSYLDTDLEERLQIGNKGRSGGIADSVYLSSDSSSDNESDSPPSIDIEFMKIKMRLEPCLEDSVTAKQLRRFFRSLSKASDGGIQRFRDWIQNQHQDPRLRCPQNWQLIQKDQRDSIVKKAEQHLPRVNITVPPWMG